MPTYKVKPSKMNSMESPMMDNSSYPSIHIPVSMEIMKTMEMGMNVEVELIGKIKSMESDDEGNEICIEIMEVSAYPVDKSKTMKEEIDEGLGYKDNEKMKGEKAKASCDHGDKAKAEAGGEKKEATKSNHN